MVDFLRLPVITEIHYFGDMDKIRPAANIVNQSRWLGGFS